MSKCVQKVHNLLIHAATPSHAANPQFCDAYANNAFEAAKQNVEFNCGFSGLRWIDSRQGHYDWCTNFKPGLAAMRGEIDTRQFKLDNEC